MSVPINRPDDAPGEQYVPASDNPIDNAADSWTRLRLEYMAMLETNRTLEAEISRKDKRTEDLSEANARLQADRDLAVETAVELKAGLIQAGDLVLGLMTRANQAFRSFRGAVPATTTAGGVSTCGSEKLGGDERGALVALGPGQIEPSPISADGIQWTPGELETLKRRGDAPPIHTLPDKFVTDGQCSDAIPDKYDVAVEYGEVVSYSRPDARLPINRL